MSKGIYGVGINDVIGSSKENYYRLWRGLISKCYNVKDINYDSDSHVCDEWLYLSNFKDWYEKNREDGDFLSRHDVHLQYSPHNCYFKPKAEPRVLWDKGLLTSVGNATRPPKAMRFSVEDGHTNIVNYGAGAFHREHSEIYPQILFHNYDPNVQEISEKPSFDKEYDAVICCNVLNVIEDMRVIEDILSDLDKYKAKIIYIYVYCGDRGGVFGISSKGTPQRNTRAKDYTFLKDWGYTYIGRGGGMWIKKNVGGMDETSF